MVYDYFELLNKLADKSKKQKLTQKEMNAIIKLADWARVENGMIA